MKRYDVITLADMSADLMVWGDDLEPDFGQKEKVLNGYKLEMGGSCAIFACQAAKLGLRTGLIGTVGKDQIGELVVHRLAESGVDVQNVIWRDDITTSLGIAMCKGNTRAIFSVLEGLNATEYEQIPREFLESARHLHIGSYFLLSRLRPHMPEIVGAVKAAGGTISLDTNWDPEERWDDGLLELLPSIDVFLPNENELRAIMRENDLQKALDKAASIVGVCVVKSGDRGAVCKCGGELLHWDTHDVVIRDSVGAGDSFDAGFLYGWLKGLPLQTCGEIATFCGESNVTAIGGIEGQPWIGEVEQYLEMVRAQPVPIKGKAQ